MIVNLTKRVKLSGQHRYCPVVIAGNGRVKPGYVLVDGQEEYHPEGSYYLDWTEAGRRRRIVVGKDAATALNKKLKRETELKAKAQGIALAPEPGAPTGTDLKQAVADYLEDTKLTKKPKTFAAYTVSLTYFMESCSKDFVEQIDRRDMIRFTAFLRDNKKQSPRSVWNKFANVMSFLKVHNMNRVVTKRDWPRYTEEDVDIYTREQLNELMRVSSDDEKFMWNYFLMTGEREQEVRYSSWPDANLKEGIVSVRHKPDYNWTPKAYKEREIPVPDSLVKELESRKKKTGLIFHTASGKPKFDMLDNLKACARRAGLPEEEFYLHKFRATFATWHLQGGVDLRTVQAWMGHVDLESTMRYLKPARHETMRDKVNSTFV
jgi:integrase/recombinase XerD